MKAARTAENRRIAVTETRDKRGNKLDLTGRHSWEGDKAGGGLTEDFLRTWSIGLKVTIPFYDGGARAADIANARENLASAVDELTLERKRIAREAAEMRLKVEMAALKVETDRDRVEQAEEELRVEEALYKAGEGTLTRVLEKQTRLLDARLQAIRTRGEVVTTLLDYLAAIGEDPYDFLRRVAM